MVEEKRNYSLDNLKFILIVFVVYGHVIEEFGITGVLGTVRACIYCFHMPVFVFLSGYFSRNDYSQKKNIKNTLIPFFVFNSIYSLYIGDLNFLLPKYIFWYLLSLFIWRTVIQNAKKSKRLLVISLLLAIYIGFLNEADRFLALSRTFCFFPYFLLGWIVSEDRFARKRQIPISISVGGIVIVELFVCLADTYKIMPVKMYELIESYNSTLSYSDVSFQIDGWILRCMVYFIGFLMIFFIVNLFQKESRLSWMSKWGSRTAAILLYSGFFVKIFFYIVRKIGLLDNTEPYNQLIIGLVLTILTVYICGNSIVYKLYGKTIDKIAYFVCGK